MADPAKSELEGVAMETEGEEVVDVESDVEVTCYCGKGRDGLMYFCDGCKQWFHSGCLKTNRPSCLEGDNFFRFTCARCDEKGQEGFERVRLTWQQVVVLTMYNLQLAGRGKKGYFRWKEDICSFIEKNWTLLLGDRKKTSTWWSTVAGVLSVGNHQVFRSGAREFNEPAWWGLIENKPPVYWPENSGEAPPKQVFKRPRRDMFEPTIRVEGLRCRKKQMSIQSAMEIKEKRSRTLEAKDIRKAKKGTSVSPQAGSTSSDTSPNVSREDLATPTPTPSDDLVSEFSETEMFAGLDSRSACSTPLSGFLTERDLRPDETLPEAILSDDADLELDPGIELPPSNLFSSPTPPPATPLEGEGGKETKKASTEESEEGESEGEEEQKVKEEVVEKEEEVEDEKSGVKKKKEEDEEEKEEPKKPRYVAMSLYEERQLLRHLNAHLSAVDNIPQARRLRRKLLVRQMKRERGLPLFDMDAAVAASIQEATGTTNTTDGAWPEPFSPSRIQGLVSRSSGDFRILDRFQSRAHTVKAQGQQPRTFLNRLVGTDDQMAMQSIISPYTARVLKPYIRRDYESRPLKLRLLLEIQAYTHRKDPTWAAPPPAPIDYCYVRPQHVPTVNALCRQFFWPGIDLSECLQYPDFSVVVLYKKVVIGFSFLVPDVKINEAYVSFVLVHPEWRQAGIGTFMMYHLIQTCMGKDVTLHVSATNPAMMLYQKFGFKVEEFVLDFYDKYYPEDSTECKHAFFLRLRR
ncbi:cysteine-rich protein 2-binding protein-like [Branchiostoma floridae x Branchiostoma belcheri]